MIKYFLTIIAMLSICITLQNADAFRLNDKIAVDGHVVLGKLWDVQVDANNRFVDVRLRTDSKEWYVESEVGVILYDHVRLFGGYQKLADTLTVKSGGIDILPLEQPVGLRLMYGTIEIPKFIEEQDFFMSAVTFKW
jgi:hypothetical protein